MTFGQDIIGHFRCITIQTFYIIESSVILLWGHFTTEIGNNRYEDISQGCLSLTSLTGPASLQETSHWIQARTRYTTHQYMTVLLPDDGTPLVVSISKKNEQLRDLRTKGEYTVRACT